MNKLDKSKTLLDDLKLVSEEVVIAKEDLDKIEREYVKIKSQLVIDSLKTFTNAEAREAGVTLQLESQYEELMNKLWDLRGLVRKFQIQRENLILEIKNYD